MEDGVERPLSFSCAELYGVHFSNVALCGVHCELAEGLWKSAHIVSKPGTGSCCWPKAQLYWKADGITLDVVFFHNNRSYADCH